MDCKNCIELMMNSFDEGFENHQRLDDCLSNHPDCLEQYEQMQEMMQKLQELPDLSVPLGFRNKWQQSLHQAQRQDRTFVRKRRFAQWGLAVAAIAFMVVLIPSLAPSSEDMAKEEDPMSAAEVASAPDQGFNQVESFNGDGLDFDEEGIDNAPMTKMALQDPEAALDAVLTVALVADQRERVLAYLEEQEIEYELVVVGPTETLEKPEKLVSEIDIFIEEEDYQAMIKNWRENEWLIQATPWEDIVQEMRQVRLVFQ